MSITTNAAGEIGPGLVARLLGSLIRPAATLVLPARSRAALKALSRKQISDAGICLTEAGRGKAADIDPVVQSNLLSLR